MKTAFFSAHFNVRTALLFLFSHFYLTRMPLFVLLILPGLLFSAADTADMALIPAGEFIMGSAEEAGVTDEHPMHKVTLAAFWMDRYEMTQETYQRMMNDNPSSFESRPRAPVETVSWKEAEACCRAFGKRLPTEAEWEYACRAGSTSPFYWGDAMDRSFAVYEGNARKKSLPVGSKKPNAFGLYDMSGNVWEWCSDFYSSGYYGKSPEKNPKGPAKTSSRVIRGGSWASDSSALRSAVRNSAYSDMRVNDLGFRCVRSNP